MITTEKWDAVSGILVQHSKGLILWRWHRYGDKVRAGSSKSDSPHKWYLDFFTLPADTDEDTKSSRGGGHCLTLEADEDAVSCLLFSRAMSSAWEISMVKIKRSGWREPRGWWRPCTVKVPLVRNGPGTFWGGSTLMCPLSRGQGQWLEIQ